MAVWQQSHVMRNTEVNSETILSPSLFFFKLFQDFTMIHSVAVLYLFMLSLLRVAAFFDHHNPKWPVPYRYENAFRSQRRSHVTARK